jgi:hypothetical protein
MALCTGLPFAESYVQLNRDYPGAATVSRLTAIRRGAGVPGFFQTGAAVNRVLRSRHAVVFTALSHGAACLPELR